MTDHSQIKAQQGVDAGAPDEALQPSSDWVQMTQYGPFTRLVGPFFTSTTGLTGSEPLRYGFRVQAHQCNPSGVCHGGMLATFLDLVLGHGGKTAHAITGNTATISMTMDFLSAAQLHDWVESRVNILHRTPRTSFVDALLVGPNDRPLVRGSAVFRLPRQNAKQT